MRKQTYTLESLLLMVLVELDSEIRFKTMIGLDERIKGLELEMSDDQVRNFVKNLQTNLESLVLDGFHSFVITSSKREGRLHLNISGEKKSYVFGYQRQQVDISC